MTPQLVSVNVGMPKDVQWRLTRVSPVIEGNTYYRERPLEEPAAGSVLLCTATPQSDLVLDL